MSPLRFALFATAIGECALAWNDVGLVGVWLPETRSGDLRRKLERRFTCGAEAGPDGAIVDAIASIRQLLDGLPVDLRSIALDWSVVTEPARRVYELAREVGPGRVVAYGAIARALGGDVDARSVGQALGANPFTIVVPCHRVIAADGRLGGFSAPGGAAQKQRLLAIEQARPDGPPGLFDDPCGELNPPAASATAATPGRLLPVR